MARAPPALPIKHSLLPPATAQWFYFFGFILAAVASWLLRDYGESVLDFYPLNQCLAETVPPGNRSCLGQEAVVAISFGTFSFFALHMVLLLGVSRASNWRLPLHTGLWPLKALLWGGACAGFLWAPPSALNGFAQAARVFSGFFIVLQVGWCWGGAAGGQVMAGALRQVVQ